MGTTTRQNEAKTSKINQEKSILWYYHKKIIAHKIYLVNTPKINLSLRRAPNGFFAVFYLFFPQNKVFKLIDKGIAFAILLIADGYSYIRGNLIGGMTKPSFE
ncbi:MAG TPA: hypothetical protein PLS05_07395 [Clostridia bacterium]|jgi:hypothetical protein|nr:hypothetical protein [Clostridia bacterium]HPO54296.1 hypothetical protein [Clostridia bacterium]